MPVPKVIEEEQTKKKNKKIQDIILTQEHLEKMKNDLNRMIDVMAENPSLFSRASRFWGKMPLWQKIIAGIFVVLPTLLIGSFTGIGTLIAISICSLIAYTAGGLLLNNHQYHNTNTTDDLKSGVAGLAGLLGTVILSLEDLRKQFAEAIDEMKEENASLKTNVTEFQKQIKALTAQIKQLEATTASLTLTKQGLEQTASSLQETVANQNTLLNENQQLIKQTQKDFEASQKELTAQIAELNEIKTNLELKLTETDTLATTLKAAVKTLSDMVVADEQQKTVFQAKLTDFLENKSASFDQVADRICKAEEELAKVKEELENANEKYKLLIGEHKQLLDRQGEQIDRLTAATSSNRHGFYSKQRNESETEALANKVYQDLVKAGLGTNGH